MSDDRIEEWLAEGRRTYPGVAIDVAAFRAAAGSECTEATDLFLAVACAHGDRSAIARFEREHLAKVGSWLKLPASENAIVDEVRQRVAARVLVGCDGEAPRISQYSGRGPLSGWVRIVALREHARLRRETRREAPLEPGREALDHLTRSGQLSPELLALQQHRDAMMAAFRDALRALPAADRTLLRLAYVDGLSLDAIGRMYGVNKSTISRRLATVRSDILAAATDTLRARLALPAADLESLLGVMPRDLDDSLLGLLKTVA